MCFGSADSCLWKILGHAENSGTLVDEYALQTVADEHIIFPLYMFDHL